MGDEMFYSCKFGILQVRERRREQDREWEIGGQVDGWMDGWMDDMHMRYAITCYATARQDVAVFQSAL